METSVPRLGLAVFPNCLENIFIIYNTIMTRHTRITQELTKTNRTRKSKKSIRRSKEALIRPIFIPSAEGEDIIEANLAFLIELAGSDFYSLYVDILNERLEEKLGEPLTDEEKIQIILENDFNTLSRRNVKKQKSEVIPEVIPKVIPRIFHTTSTVTHFKASIDGIHKVNSYKNDLQKNRTNHFCQSFALMFIEASLFPDTETAREYEEMIKNAKNSEIYKNSGNLDAENSRLIHNAFVAKNYACEFIKTVCNRMYENDIIDIFNNILDPPDNEHHLSEDLQNTDRITLLKDLLNYCKNLSEDDLSTSTFRKQVVD